MSAMTLWARDIWDAISTTAIGMHITWRHLFTRKVTLLVFGALVAWMAGARLAKRRRVHDLAA